MRLLSCDAAKTTDCTSSGILFLAFVILYHPDAADAGPSFSITDVLRNRDLDMHIFSGSSGSAAAAAVWQRLTELVQRPAEAQDEDQSHLLCPVFARSVAVFVVKASYWSRALTTLHSEHPHPAAQKQ